MKNEYRGTRIPQSWYNLRADLSEPLPPPLGADGHPLAAKEWEPLFTPSLVEQEYSCERLVPVPEEVLERLSAWRPTPLRRAKRFEEALGTKARIYYKDESVSPAGSHKATTAVAQAYYNKIAGVKRLVTETGAGQWGSALSLACGFFGLQCLVYMVRNSYEKKPLRRILMETWGGAASQPDRRDRGSRQALKRDPNTPGSLESPSPRPSRGSSPMEAERADMPWEAFSTMFCCTRASSAWRRWSRFERAERGSRTL